MLKKVGIGLLSGFISGLIATGGGIVLLPAYIYCFKLKLSFYCIYDSVDVFIC